MKWNAWYYCYSNRASHGIIAYYIIMHTDNITGFLMNAWMERQATGISRKLNGKITSWKIKRLGEQEKAILWKLNYKT